MCWTSVPGPYDEGGSSHLGDVHVAQRLLPLVADLPQGGPEAPLVGRLAQVACVLDALGGHPGDTLHQDWGGEEGRENYI